jgi:hypothetical protein
VSARPVAPAQPRRPTHQDFARGGLETLDFLLQSPGEDTLWVFHDPWQALYRDPAERAWTEHTEVSWRTFGS